MVKIITALEALAMEQAMEAAQEALEQMGELYLANDLADQILILKKLEQKDIEELLNEVSDS